MAGRLRTPPGSKESNGIDSKCACFFGLPFSVISYTYVAVQIVCMGAINKIKKMTAALLTGNEAIAVGAHKAGVDVATGYPGTPSSEILPYLARFKNVVVNWSINEKTALEIAIGASIGYKRSMFTTKHVGLNVASDPLMTLGITGVRGGLVIVTTDDPNMHSSQNEQDNRFYAKFAKIPMLEPSDSSECIEFTNIAFEMSEKFDTPVVIRTTTRVSHSKSITHIEQPIHLSNSTCLTHIDNPTLKEKNYTKDIEKFVMVPVYARKRHRMAVKRLEYLQEFSNNSGINKIEYNSLDVGIITSGISYQYVKEIAPFASVLKLSLSYPIPDSLIKEFSKKVKNIVIVEELEPFVQNEISSTGISLKGKEFFDRCGELTPDSVKDGLARAGVIEKQVDKISHKHGYDGECLTELNNLPKRLPARLPALCSGCPHTSIFYALKKLRVPVMGDIGCYTLGALPPLNAMDSCISMGLAFGAAQGLSLSNSSPKKIVGIMGDSTFFHSGITSLIDAKYNNACFTAIILDNSTTAMTGGQNHPGTGKNISSEQQPQGCDISCKIDIKKVVEAIGIDEIYEVDPYKYNDVYKTLKKALGSKKLNVIITKRPCVLYPAKLDFGKKFEVLDSCNGCGLCMQTGCPSILNSNKFSDNNQPIPFIDNSCIGCSVCKDVCTFGCIKIIDL